MSRSVAHSRSKGDGLGGALRHSHDHSRSTGFAAQLRRSERPAWRSLVSPTASRPRRPGDDCGTGLGHRPSPRGRDRSGGNSLRARWRRRGEDSASNRNRRCFSAARDLRRSGQARTNAAGRSRAARRALRVLGSANGGWPACRARPLFSPLAYRTSKRDPQVVFMDR